GCGPAPGGPVRDGSGPDRQPRNHPHSRAGGVGAGRVEADLATDDARAGTRRARTGRGDPRRLPAPPASRRADGPQGPRGVVMSAHPKRSDAPPTPRFSTVSDMEIAPLCTPDDLPDDPGAIARPGEFPYTRGPYATMYRGRPWTMRQFAGFGTARDTNARFKFLLSQGQTGLSTAFDMPTLMGYDADHARALGEVGREGTAVSTLDDMAELFDGIDLGAVTTSMTVNCSASIILAMYFAVAERKGTPMTALGGTIQNDMLKEFIAQKEWISPPLPSVRVIIDMIEFCTREAPRFHPVSISGYHIREAGSTAVQEVAFTLADGIGYVDAAVKRGLAVDDFGPRLSFFF